MFGKRTKQHSDEELIALYKQSGDPVHAGELYMRYTQLISALAYKYLKDANETEDAAMDIFEVLLRDLKSHEVKNFKAWLFSVTKNHCLKRKRQIAKERKGGEQVLINEAPVLGLNAEEEREQAILKNERMDKIEEALGELTAEQRRCVEMFYLKQMSYQEISDETGFTLKAVKSYIQNGKRNIKIRVLHEGHEQKNVRYGG